MRLQWHMTGRHTPIGRKQPWVPRRELEVERRACPLNEIRTREALLAVEQCLATRCLAVDLVLGQLQEEVPVLMTEHDVLGVREPEVEYVAVDKGARVDVVLTGKQPGVVRRRLEIV